jgi:hypothetical protein
MPIVILCAPSLFLFSVTGRVDSPPALTGPRPSASLPAFCPLSEYVGRVVRCQGVISV